MPSGACVGARPRELLAVGLREYRETFFKPYRILYRVEGNLVIVYLVADGRRDMQALLSARLPGGGTYTEDRIREFDSEEADLEKAMARAIRPKPRRPG